MTESIVKKPARAKKQSKLKTAKDVVLSNVQNTLPENTLATKILKEDGSNPIKTIYHISDVHIENKNTRYGEYKIVFDRLYREIKKDLLGSIIVLTGDIVHNNCNLFSDQVEFLIDFFIELTKLTDLVIIIGNHDTNAANNHLDSISSVIKHIQTEHKLHLLLDNGLYTYNNIIFGVTTMGSKIVTPCDLETDKIKIGLFHGCVGRALTDENFDLGSRSQFKVTDFTSIYDLTMLGDVHRHQYLDAAKTIAYASSLVQRDISEDLFNHGMIKWNIIDKTSEFIRIKNDYGFVQIDLKSNELPPITYEMPKYPQIRISYKNLTREQIEAHIKYLTEKYNAKCTAFENMSELFPEISLASLENNSEQKITDIKSNEGAKKIMLDYLKKESDLDELTLKLIESKIDEMLEDKDHNYNNQDKKFKLLNVEFDNFYIYKEGNFLNFEEMHKIVGIQGESFSGKSTLIDIILFGLYGEVTRPGSQKSDTININKKSMKIKIMFQVNSDVYTIERQRKRMHKSSSEKVTLRKNGEDISKKDITSTNNELKTIICERDIFINICIMLQENSENFVMMSNSDKRKMLCKLLKLDVFSDILVKVNSEIGSKNKEQRNIYDPKKNDKLIDAQLKELTTKKDKLTAEQTELDAKLTIIQSEVDELRTETIEHSIKIKTYEKTQYELIGLKEKFPNIETKMKSIKESLIIQDKEITSLTADHKAKIKELERLNKTNDVTPSNIKLIEKRNQDYQKARQSQLEQLEEKQHTLRSEMIPNNLFKSDITDTKSNLTNQKKKIVGLSNKIGSNDTTLNDLTGKIIDVQITDKLTSNYEKYNAFTVDNESNITELNTIKHQLTEIQKRHQELTDHEYNKDCTACMKNPTTKEILRCIELEGSYNLKINTLNKKLSKINGSIKVLTKDFNKYNEQIEIQENNEQLQTQIEKLSNENKILNLELENLNQKVEISNSILEEYQVYLMNTKLNKELTEQCDVIKKEISQIKLEECTPEYQAYVKLSEQINKLNCNIKEVNYTINNARTKREQNQIALDKLIDQHTKYKDSLEKLSDYELINKKHKSLQAQLSTKEMMRTEFETSLKKIVKDLMQSEVDINRETLSIKDYQTIRDDIEILTKIQRLLDKDGLVDNILSKNVIPKLEATVNNIFSYIADYKVEIKYDKGSIDIIKINKDGKAINISTLSGCESFICNLSFRLALAHWNSYVKCNFMILDESLKYSDNKFISNLPKLFDYMTKHFSWVMIISHDERIIRLYNETIKVERTENGSEVKYGKIGKKVAELIDTESSNDVTDEPIREVNICKAGELKPVKRKRPEKKILVKGKIERTKKQSPEISEIVDELN
ncbi:MAG: DNA repair exonuclease [Harvfovirus sp.]|uniref:DNA repair exonuclease n=1 Tax=Harvfovirus sp. TaxID=2487768 RepID=A0A3G5A2X2_9VIRU|nr:MAG: DNA repair exonuclease [Harvfovirus sp.]